MTILLILLIALIAIYLLSYNATYENKKIALPTKTSNFLTPRAPLNIIYIENRSRDYSFPGGDRQRGLSPTDRLPLGQGLAS